MAKLTTRPLTSPQLWRPPCPAHLRRKTQRRHKGRQEWWRPSTPRRRWAGRGLLGLRALIPKTAKPRIPCQRDVEGHEAVSSAMTSMIFSTTGSSDASGSAAAPARTWPQTAARAASAHAPLLLRVPGHGPRPDAQVHGHCPTRPAVPPLTRGWTDDTCGSPVTRAGRCGCVPDPGWQQRPRARGCRAQATVPGACRKRPPTAAFLRVGPWGTRQGGDAGSLLARRHRWLRGRPRRPQSHRLPSAGHSR